MGETFKEVGEIFEKESKRSLKNLIPSKQNQFFYDVSKV